MRAPVRIRARNEGDEGFVPFLLIPRVHKMENDLLTAEELAERLGVKPRTVKGWLQTGLIPATRLTRKVIRYDLEQVVDALKRRQTPTEVRHASE